MNIEDFFIASVKEGVVIGDDGALMGGWVYSMDAFFENVHYKRAWMSLRQIAYKAMAINISDAVAMNAEPVYALITLAAPPELSRHEIAELAEGLKSAARFFGVRIIGGDTIANVKLDLSVTIISRSRRPLLRRGLKNGDLLAFTGTLGSSDRDLKRLLRGGRVTSRSKFIMPHLRRSFVRRAAPHLHAGMDISDGLICDLNKLCTLNRMGYRLARRIPKQIACSGEEYEMLVAFPRRKLNAVRRAAQASRTPLNVFGQAVRGRAVNACKPHHF